VTAVYRWFRYVRHADREQAEADGWVFSADLGRHHGHYSILMEWSLPGTTPLSVDIAGDINYPSDIRKRLDCRSSAYGFSRPTVAKRHQ